MKELRKGKKMRDIAFFISKPCYLFIQYQVMLEFHVVHLIFIAFLSRLLFKSKFQSQSWIERNSLEIDIEILSFSNTVVWMTFFFLSHNFYFYS